jgi:mono/diheme cytochrome c family protein
VLFRIVKEGSPAQDSPMRGWKGRMSDEEIRSVLAYVRTLWPEGILARYRQGFPNG